MKCGDPHIYSEKKQSDHNCLLVLLPATHNVVHGDLSLSPNPYDVEARRTYGIPDGTVQSGQEAETSTIYVSSILCPLPNPIGNQERAADLHSMLIKKRVGVFQISVPACGGGVDLAPSPVNAVILQGVAALPSHPPHYHQQDASAMDHSDPAVGLEQWTPNFPTNLWDTLILYGVTVQSHRALTNLSTTVKPDSPLTSEVRGQHTVAMSPSHHCISMFSKVRRERNVTYSTTSQVHRLMKRLLKSVIQPTRAVV